MIHILSPEQQSAVHVMQSSDTSSVKYFDLDTALTAVLEVVMDNLVNDKSVLIHMPPEHDGHSQLLDLLNKCELADLTIIADQKQHIPEVDVVKLRSTIKKEVNVQPIISDITASQSLRLLEDELQSFYARFDREVIPGISARQFYNQKIYAAVDSAPRIDLSHQLYGQDEVAAAYGAYRICISRGAALYKSEFELYDKLDLLSDAVWLSDESMRHTLIQNLRDAENQVSELCRRFESAKRNILTSQASTISAHTSELRDVLLQKEKECLTLSISNQYAEQHAQRFSLFKKKDKNPIDTSLSSMWSDILEKIKLISIDWHQEFIQRVPPVSIDELLSEIHTIWKGISEQERHLSTAAHRQLHRINRINTSSEDVRVLDSDLVTLVSELKTLGIFTTLPSSNSLSFLKQEQFCTDLYHYVSSCLQLLSDKTGYVQWKAYCTQQEVAVLHLISKLKRFPTASWIDIYDQSYDAFLVQDMQRHTDITSDLQAYATMIRQRLSNIGSSILNQKLKHRKEAAEALRAQNKELYNTLFKKKALPESSWNDLLLMNRDFLKSFFAIHIVHELKYTAAYDCVISFDSPPETDGITSGHFLSRIQKEDLDSANEGNTSFMYLNAYPYTVPLSELAHSDRLKAAKKLSKYILSLNQSAKIYQTKNANIISLLPLYDDNHLEQQLLPLGAKSIDIEGNLYEKLTESILFTNRPQYLLIKDRLLNPTLHSHLAWQLDVLSKFKSAGIEIISINTEDQLTDNEGIYRRIIDQLADQKPDISDRVSDEVLETA